ncbi:MAG: hypothetical protein KOO63_14590 [Bacteroidales bacterium]|nr:hypothetical protein [Candidatus Latescibacterota bacterium]
MKHQTHIYIARKAIELLYDSLNNLKYPSGQAAASSKKTAWRREAKDLQRILYSHIGSITEASWAPDDILCDKSTFHVFKLYTEDEFTDFADFSKEIHVYHSKNYHRASGGGGLPYKVDHLARMINDMLKLRQFNDSFNMEHIMYQFFLLSHYVVDAHVPMHCDIRDDNPGSKKPSEGLYYPDKWHGKLEQTWEDAVLPVGIEENLIIAEKGKEMGVDSEYSDSVAYNLKKHAKEIDTFYLEPRKLLDYMIDLCIKSKKRNQRLFPIADPSEPVMAKFDDITREIFNAAIGNVISIWMCIWAKN